MQTRYYHRSTTSHKPSPLGMDYIHLHLFVIYLMHAIITSTNPTIIAWHHWCPTVERIHNTMMMYVSAMNWYWLVPLKYPCTTKGKREYVHAIRGSLLISSFKMYSYHALCCTCICGLATCLQVTSLSCKDVRYACCLIPRVELFSPARSEGPTCSHLSLVPMQPCTLPCSQPCTLASCLSLIPSLVA